MSADQIIYWTERNKEEGKVTSVRDIEPEKEFIIMKASIILFFCFLISVKLYSQQTINNSGLEFIPGKIETYYVEGYKEKAEYLQTLLEDAVHFYEKKLNDTFSFELFVLDRKEWKKYTEIPYPVPHYINSEKRMIMPVSSFFKVNLPSGDSLYEKTYYYLTDFAAVHELGHYIARKQNTKSHSKWSGEFFADFILVAYMHELIPEFELDNKPSKFFQYLPLKNKSLEKYVSAGIVNEMFYHAKFQELGNQIYLKNGMEFMYRWIELYSQINTDIQSGKYENITYSNKMIFQKSIENIQSIEPEIFNEWNNSMRQTYHSWLILFSLVIIIVIIRIADTSFSIFTNFDLKTKRVHRISGVPLFRIWVNLENIKSKSIKNKLIRISILRIISFLLVLVLLFLLALLIG